MKEIKIGLHKKRPAENSKVILKKIDDKGKVKRSKIIGFVLLFTILFCGGIVYWFGRDYIKMFFSGNSNCTGENCQSGGIFDAFTKDPELKKQNDMTNVLLVGIDTRDEQPGLLNTDTIMVLSYNHTKGTLTMISLPRDLYVKIPTTYPYYSRINSAYAQGVKDSGHEKGIEYLESIVKGITGLEMQYNIMINYDGFKEVIDAVDGIEVDVKNEFWGQYPAGENWESVHFATGVQHMNGETALKYARTRYANAESGEASDYARAKRQQIVITAVKDKLLSVGTFMNPVKLMELAKIAGDNIRTSEYNQEDIRAGVNIVKSFDNSKITNVVLEPSIANYTLIGVLPGAAYHIGPKAADGGWDEIQKFVQDLIKSPEVFQEQASVYVYNGGAAAGSGGELVEKLIVANSHLTVKIGGNTVARDYKGLTIYDFSGGEKDATLAEIQRILPGARLMTEIPDGIDNSYSEDIVIVVGSEETAAEE